MEPIVSSETSAIKSQTPGNYPKRNKLHLQHGESLRTRKVLSLRYLVLSRCQDACGAWHCAFFFPCDYTLLLLLLLLSICRYSFLNFRVVLRTAYLLYWDLMQNVIQFYLCAVCRISWEICVFGPWTISCTHAVKPWVWIAINTP